MTPARAAAVVLALSFAAEASAQSAPAPACRPAQFRVALDVGHTLEAPGATSARGRAEFLFNRDLAGAVRAALAAAGFTATPMIGIDGADRTLAERVEAINAARPDLLLSIHHDSVQPQFLEAWTVDGGPQSFTTYARGFSLFLSARNPGFERARTFAGWLGDSLLAAGFRPSRHHGEAIAGENRPIVDEGRGVYRYDGLAVLRGSAAPAVLIEAEVIKHRDAERDARTPAFQERLARAIAAAVGVACRSWSEAGG